MKNRNERLRTISLDIGLALKDILEEDGIRKVYPVVADVDIQGEFVVYRRAGMILNNTKDIYNDEEVVEMEFIAVGSSYAKALNLAKRIKNALEGYRGLSENIPISNIIMNDASEDYVSESFLQIMTFSVVIDTSRYISSTAVGDN